jgi:hypothetical protein
MALKCVCVDIVNFSMEEIKAEVNILKQCLHPNIVQCNNITMNRSLSHVSFPTPRKDVEICIDEGVKWNFWF